MTNKLFIISSLGNQFTNWNELLISLDVQQINVAIKENSWSIKQILTHLVGWLEISIARMEAGLSDSEPIFPDWLGRRDPENNDVDNINQDILCFYFSLSWIEIMVIWKQRYTRLMDLASKASFYKLFDSKKFPWLGDHSLYDVLDGSLNHHREHYDSLLNKLQIDQSKDE